MAGTVLVSGGSGCNAGYLIRQPVGAGWAVHTNERSLARADLPPHVRAFVEDRIAVLVRGDAVVSREGRGQPPRERPPERPAGRPLSR